jgi:hypothetical protein
MTELDDVGVVVRHPLVAAGLHGLPTTAPGPPVETRQDTRVSTSQTREARPSAGAALQDASPDG